MDARSPDARPRLALALGDPNGIGPEIALKAVLDAELRAVSQLVLVGDRSAIERCATRLGCAAELCRLLDAEAIGFEAVETGLDPRPGVISPDAGRATIAYAKRAIALAECGGAAAVVAGPHNETAVARAGIKFSGYPGLLAEATRTSPDQVFLMLVSPRLKIVHVTLHMGLRVALDSITSERTRPHIRGNTESNLSKRKRRPRLRIQIALLDYFVCQGPCCFDIRRII